MLPTLKFKNFVFHDGLNITVRNGLKWNMKNPSKFGIAESTDKVEIKMPIVFIGSFSVKFKDIPKDILKYEHDPDCQTYDGLLNVMKKVYPGFKDNNIVTIALFSKRE